MRPLCRSYKFVYALAVAAILFSQPVVSQTQPPSQTSTNSAETASNTKPNTGKVNCTNNGTYVNSNLRVSRSVRIDTRRYFRKAGWPKRDFESLLL
jgi:hypothetical protein